ncbi:MAG: T9SS type A sorting domain-containing protein [Chitinophagales bacterium]|nr:T9SS type A sorting domain-containing protein [Chitinophagales bacterium]
MLSFYRILSIIVLLTAGANRISAQFAPAAGLHGSTALWKDSSIFIAWATGCTLQRGYMDIAQPDSGFASVGNVAAAIGAAGTNGVVSLGDGGSATLTFAQPIYNGPGFDFAVFENGFATGETGMAFLEFAFVEVSSDGINFVRFPAISHIQDTAQLAMVGIDCSLVHNLAGKYVNGYGTPFDLEELKDKPGLDVNHITHVRVIDVVGSIHPNFATYDSEGHKVNDPYPTPFPSGGFDLDAVGVINAVNVSAISDFEFRISNFETQVFPNPAASTDVELHVFENFNGSVTLSDLNGEVLQTVPLQTTNCKLQTAHLQRGIYFITVTNHSQTITRKLIVQ